MPAVYYVRQKGRIIGPFDVASIQKLARRRQISRFDEISPDRLNWSTVGEFEDVFPSTSLAADQQPAASVASSSEAAQKDIASSGGTRTAEHSSIPAVRYYYSQGGTTVGPVPVGVLRSLAENGTLRATDMVWAENAEIAAPASQIAHVAAVYSRTALRSAGSAAASSTTKGDAAGAARFVRQTGSMSLVTGFVTGGLLLVLSMLPIVVVKGKALWWWDVLGASGSVLFGIFCIYNLICAIALFVFPGVVKGLSRAIPYSCLAGIGLSIWLVSTAVLQESGAAVLLSVCYLLIPIGCAALATISRVRSYSLAQAGERVLAGICGGVLGVVSLTILLVMLVEIAATHGPVPGWAITVTVMLILASLSSLAGGILGAIGAAIPRSQGVIVATTVCCLTAIFLGITSFFTAVIGIADDASSLMRAIGNMMDGSGSATPSVGWLVFVAFRLLVVFYSFLLLFCAGIRELLVNLYVTGVTVPSSPTMHAD